MAPATPSKATLSKPAAGESDASSKEAEFLIAVLQSLETEPKVDLAKLAELTGMKTKASANTKWYKLRQKYMPNAMSPSKRKAEGDGADSGVNVKPEAVAKPKTPKKSKTQKDVKARMEEDNGDDEETKDVKKERKTEEVGVQCEGDDE